MNDIILAIEYLKKARDLVLLSGEKVVKEDKNQVLRMLDVDSKIENTIEDLMSILKIKENNLLNQRLFNLQNNKSK